MHFDQALAAAVGRTVVDEEVLRLERVFAHDRVQSLLQFSQALQFVVHRDDERDLHGHADSYS